MITWIGNKTGNSYYSFDGWWFYPKDCMKPCFSGACATEAMTAKNTKIQAN